jgi:ATP-binding cassette subfamily F protein 3
VLQIIIIIFAENYYIRMISVEGLGMDFSAKPLFQNVTFTIDDRDHIALVGKNGAGKSTMLKILCGLLRPTTGVVNVSNGTRIGYLPQVMKLSDNTTLHEEVLKAFTKIMDMKAEIEKMQDELKKRTDYESRDYGALVEKFSLEQERFQLLGAENYEADIERILIGLGFLRTDFDRPTSEFSGGWRMRVELAKILLGKPDVLLLDEPTNHLDIESISWLEQQLLQSQKALVLISHDRAFINNVTDRTIEITCGHVVDYRAKYNDFVTLRAELRQQQKRAYDNQQKEIADIKDFIERFRYKPTKAVQVQSRIKQLQKIVPIEIDEVDTSALRLKFPPCQRSGDFPVICKDVKKDYGEKTIFSNVTLSVKRGEKVAFVGKNGEGKSTLVKCIMNQIPFDGDLKVGHNVQIGYFAQNQAQLLDENISVYDTIDNVAKGEIRLKIKDILGAFMFGGEASDKKVGVLSGGERSRLAMIKLLLEPVNLLILDEPTNHLDIPSKEVLKNAIKAFNGTAIIVSHDREFLDGLVTKVYEFSCGKVREHLGGIYDYLRSKAKEVAEMSSHSMPDNYFLDKKNNSAQTILKSDNSGTAAFCEHKQQQKELRKAEKEVKESEMKIASMETRISELDKMFSISENASDMTLVTEYTATKQALDEENERWLVLAEKFEELKNIH